MKWSVHDRYLTILVFNPATSDGDYGSSVESVTLPATMSSVPMTFTLPANVTLIDDTILEFDEDFTVFLDTTIDPPFGVMYGSQVTTTVALGDDGMSARYDHT